MVGLLLYMLRVPLPVWLRRGGPDGRIRTYKYLVPVAYSVSRNIVVSLRDNLSIWNVMGPLLVLEGYTSPSICHLYEPPLLGGGYYLVVS